MKSDLVNIGIKELALLVSAELEKQGIEAVLVGGACVSIYSKNKYISGDLDFISSGSTDKITEALKNIGFYKKSGFRHYFHNDCPLFIEFPPGPVSIGNETPVKNFNKIKSLKLFTPTDCVKDRLAAFYHWNDLQSLDQALLVTMAQEIDLKEVEKWSRGEKAGEKYKRFLALI